MIKSLLNKHNGLGESGAGCNIFNVLVFLQVIINFMNEVILSSELRISFR